MDEEQIKELVGSILKTQLGELNKTITSYVEAQLGALRAEIPQAKGSDSDTTEATGDRAPESAALLATQRELQELKQKLAEQAEAESSSRLESLVLSYAANKGLTAPSLLVDIVKTRFKPSLVEDNKQWFYKDGDKVSAIESKLDEFLGTTEGKVLLPPTGANGSSAIEGSKKSATNGAIDPWEHLAQQYATAG